MYNLIVKLKQVELHEDAFDKFGELLQTRGHNFDDLDKFVDKQPIRIAQRLLRQYGDEAEEMVIKLFPNKLTRDKIITALKQQRSRYSGQQWSKRGLVRTY